MIEHGSEIVSEVVESDLPNRGVPELVGCAVPILPPFPPYSFRLGEHVIFRQEYPQVRYEIRLQFKDSSFVSLASLNRHGPLSKSRSR